MKKRVPTFIAGMLTMALIGSLGVSALAASGAVTFNTSALQLNGQQISAKGENYTLANGQSVPACISYTDEQGGATTYLPVRRLAELLGVEVGWDQTTGSVTVSGDIKVPATPTPDTTTPPDYSTWSAEDEAAYQEFKGMWVVQVVTVNGNDERQIIYIGNLNSEQFDKEYMTKFNNETHSSEYDKLFERILREHIGTDEYGYIYTIKFHETHIGGIRITFNGEVRGGLDPSWVHA